MGRILLVEDTPEYQRLVERSLGHHTVTVVDTVDGASEFLDEHTVDLILLDLNLPDKHGYSLLSELQTNPSFTTPVFCLTSKKEVTDKVTAFSLGAEDYIVKPFDPIEFKARVDAKLSKKAAWRENQILGPLHIDRVAHQLKIFRKSGEPEQVMLTQTEFKLLSCLAQRPGRVFSRDELLNSAWGTSSDVANRAVDVHVCSLRKKLGIYSKCIKAVSGVGYKLASEAFPKEGLE